MATISYLEYSNRDMKYAKDMLMLGNFDPCGRFCQQAIEKRMKYFIELNGSVDDFQILSSHSLAKLYNRICVLTKTPPDAVLRGHLYQITSYYFETNYPAEDGNIELTKEMAESALHVAMEVNDWVDSL